MEKIKKIVKKIQDGYLTEMYSEMKWIYSYARKYWRAILFYIIAGIFGTLMGFGGSIVSKYIIDSVVGRNTEHIAVMASVMLGLTVGNIFENSIISRISAKISVVIQNEIQADIYKKIIYTDWESLNSYRSGDLLNRLTSDTAQVSSSVIGWLPTVITNIMQLIGAFCIMLYYDPVMAGISIISAPITLCMSNFFLKRMRTYNKEIRRMTSDIMAFQNDSFQNIQTIKSFGLVSLFVNRFMVLQTSYKEKMLKYNKFSVYTSMVMSLTGLMTAYICFGWGAYRLWSGYITVGTMMMFLQMANYLSSACSSLIRSLPSAVNAATCAGRLMLVTELKKEKIVNERAVKELWGCKEDGITIELNDISIAYKKGNTVIKNADMSVGCGKIAAVIGPSGEGKTSIIRLMLGLINPVEGNAYLYGKNGIKCPISSGTRIFFSYVPQGNTVFPGTIAENMRMIKEDATDKEIIDALKIGCAYEFVEKLPDGINSVIGDNGTGLSEGQAQRISISRAILRDAPILLLDEATSALDMDTEKAVLSNIMSYGCKKTCIVTTHRQSVLDISDNVYKVKDGSLTKIK